MRALEIAERVQIVAEKTVLGLLLAMVDVAPRAHQLPSVRLGQQRVDLRQRGALGGIRAPDRRSLAAPHPARRPHMLREVVAEGGEKRLHRARVAVVVQSAQLPRRAVGQQHPVQQAQIRALDQPPAVVAGQREAPNGEGVLGRLRLRRGAQCSNDQRRVILHADLAYRRPIFDGQRARDPRHHIPVLRGVEVHPAKGILLRAQGRGGKEHGREKAIKERGGNEPHESRYSREAQRLSQFRKSGAGAPGIDDF